MRRWLAALTSPIAQVAGLGIGLPGLILVFLIAISAGVSVPTAFLRSLIALTVLSLIGWFGGAMIALAQQPVADD